MKMMTEFKLSLPDHEAPHPALPLIVVIVDFFLLVVLILGATPALSGGFSIEMRTNGLLQLMLPFSWIRFAVVAFALIMLVGDWNAREVGLRREDLLPGVLWTAAIWAIMTVALLIAGLLSPRGLVFHPAWNGGLAAWTVGEALSTFFGSAIADEVIYRGFLIAAVGAILPAFGAKKNVTVALVISQLLFTLSRLPLYLFNDARFASFSFNLAAAFLLGLLLALVYLRTGNLFLTIGLHALISAPLPLFDGPGWLIKALPVVVGLVIIAAGPRLIGIFRRKESTP